MRSPSAEPRSAPLTGAEPSRRAATREANIANIEVSHEGGTQYRVEVSDDRGSSQHRVTVSEEELQHFGAGASADELLRESFGFLLEREPKESILSSFELSTIVRYFPEYDGEIQRRVG